VAALLRAAFGKFALSSLNRLENRVPPIASLSLDLDNKWSYMRTHGDPGWEGFPSYLDVAVPRFLELFRSLDLVITVFVVGQDAAVESNREVLRRLAREGHEIGNHSFHHEPWLHLYDADTIRAELAAAEERILAATGQRPVGFRGPGFSVSPIVLEVLAQRGYQYDASTFPTFLGPLARAYYFLTARLDAGEKDKRKRLFGRFSEGFRPLRPYPWNVDGAEVIEIPVTTMPILRLPIHVSYLLYLATYSRKLALAYFRVALALCRACGVSPSLLLHPLDLLDTQDAAELAFFPAMRMPAAKKRSLVTEVLRLLSAGHRVVPMREHARHAKMELASRPARSLPRSR
jgi:peptidoglycan-N-acetylglucosamine deacetylase